MIAAARPIACHRAEVVDLELSLQVFPPDLGDRREPRRQPGGVEQAVEPAELQHRPAKQGVEAGVIPHVDRDADRATGKLRGDFLRDAFGHAAVEVRHHDVGAFIREPPHRGCADAAAAADHHDDMPRDQLGRLLPGDLLLHLAALQRPALELVDVALRDELEAVHRLGVGDALERGTIAKVGGHRVPLVGERGDDADAREPGRPWPSRRAGRSPATACPPVILLVLGPRGLELAPNPSDDRVVRRGRIEIEPDRKPAGPQQVLGRCHAAAHQLGHVLPVESWRARRRHHRSGG